jgi:hypothetical protein
MFTQQHSRQQVLQACAVDRMSLIHSVLAGLDSQLGWSILRCGRMFSCQLGLRQHVVVGVPAAG